MQDDVATVTSLLSINMPERITPLITVLRPESTANVVLARVIYRMTVSRRRLPMICDAMP
jgi:hypothetical protein